MTASVQNSVQDYVEHKVIATFSDGVAIVARDYVEFSYRDILIRLQSMPLMHSDYVTLVELYRAPTATDYARYALFLVGGSIEGLTSVLQAEALHGRLTPRLIFHEIRGFLKGRVRKIIRGSEDTPEIFGL